MDPRTSEPALRTRLVETAARLLAEEGPDALTTRRLGAEVGTSTMAIYTHFRGMPELRRVVSSEGFSRLAERLDAVPRTDDPVADVAAMGAAYVLNALANPHFYRFMFLERPPEDPDVGHETFERVVATVRRAVEAGRFARAEPDALARQLWAMTHGIVTLHFAGLFTLEDAFACLAEMGENLFVAFGDSRMAAAGAIGSVRASLLPPDAGGGPATAPRR